MSSSSATPYSALAAWLDGLEMSAYLDRFVDNGYDDLDICKEIGDLDLDAIGVTSAQCRHRILDAVERLRRVGSGAGGGVDPLLDGSSRPAATATPSSAAPLYFTLEAPTSTATMPVVDHAVATTPTAVAASSSPSHDSTSTSSSPRHRRHTHRKSTACPKGGDEGGGGGGTSGGGSSSSSSGGGREGGGMIRATKREVKIKSRTSVQTTCDTNDTQGKIRELLRRKKIQLQWEENAIASIRCIIHAEIDFPRGTFLVIRYRPRRIARNRV